VKGLQQGKTRLNTCTASLYNSLTTTRRLLTQLISDGGGVCRRGDQVREGVGGILNVRGSDSVVRRGLPPLHPPPPALRAPNISIQTPAHRKKATTRYRCAVFALAMIITPHSDLLNPGRAKRRINSSSAVCLVVSSEERGREGERHATGKERTM